MTVLSRLQMMAEGVVIALDAIRANKVRAGLTILGIAVGVFVVTVMAAAVHGINAGVTQGIAAAGPTTFFVTKWPAQVNSCNGARDSCPWRNFPPLTIVEAQAIARRPIIKAVIAHTNTTAQVKFGTQVLAGANVDAYTPGWLDVDPGDISAGRSFTVGENKDAAPVAIVNDAMVKQLFPGVHALGQRIRVDGNPFEVIGIYHQVGNIFNNADKPQLIVPFETARRKLNANVRWLDLTVKPRRGVPESVAMDAAIEVLRSHRALRPAQDNTFFVTTQATILDLYNRIVGAFFLTMITLSGIGLMVGGIGVVAIMMISVTERTREIGVRKALGATRATILWQFLVEASTLTVIGAVAGLAVGGGLTWLIRSSTPIQATIPPMAIVAALTASAVTGIAFGLLPAARASRLDPVEALRYE